MGVEIAKWTLDEYHQMIAAGLLQGRHVELIKGDILEMPPEGEPHAYFSSEAGDYLARLLGEQAMVRQAKPITLLDDSEPEPDVAIVQRLGREYLNHHPYPENIFWLIEYSNVSLEKDLEIKRPIYAAAEIPEYWVVNLKRRVLIVFREPQAGQYTVFREYTSGSLAPVAFPEISVAVDALIS